MDAHTVTVRGVPMRWEEAGDGPAVVLVHGIPTSPQLWRSVVPRIGGARCLAFEMVGYGASIPAGVHRDISVARQADYLLAWLEAVGVDRAVFVGHDLGGGVVQIAAVKAPQRCAGLVLANSVGYDSWPIPQVRVIGALGPLLGRLPAAATAPALARLMARGHDDADIARASFDVHWPHYAEHGGFEALSRQASQLRAADTLAIADRLVDLGAPARVLWGTADPFQSVRYGERLAWDLGTALHRIEGGRHFTPEDHPGPIADAVEAVLDEAGAR